MPAELGAAEGGTMDHAPRGQPRPRRPTLAGPHQPSGGKTVPHFSFSSSCCHNYKCARLEHGTVV